jgi:serine/threonine protein kinase
MSPEQFTGRNVDGRVDVWALAVISYRMLTGQMPFQAKGFGQVVDLIINSTPAAPRSIAPELPDGIDELFARALHKQLGERPPSARDFAIELGRLAEIGDATTVDGIDRVSVPGPEPAPPQGPPSTQIHEATTLERPAPRLADKAEVPEHTTNVGLTMPQRSRSTSLAIAAALGGALLVGGALAMAWFRAPAPAPAPPKQKSTANEIPVVELSGERPLIEVPHDPLAEPSSTSAVSASASASASSSVAAPPPPRPRRPRPTPQPEKKRDFSGPF